MHYLDNKKRLIENDPEDMYSLTLTFPDQCEEGIEIARTSALADWSVQPKTVVLTGQGGSAVGGDITKCLFDVYSNIPFFVNRDYELPKFVDNNSLVFVCSYSGNTEETLSAYHHARNQGASIVAITSGGQLADKAKRDGFPLILVPSGRPPRTALGYLLMPVLYACERIQLIPPQNYDHIFNALRDATKEWIMEQPFDQNPTKRVADAFFEKLPIIYGLGGWQGVVAGRWKAQINENSKTMAFSNTFPELNHNEIMGWVNADEQGVRKWITAILEDGIESPKMRTRARVTSELIQNRTNVLRVQTKGTSLLEKILYLTSFGDFVSIYLAALYKVDPADIVFINRLKEELSKVN